MEIKERVPHNVVLSNQVFFSTDMLHIFYRKLVCVQAGKSALHFVKPYESCPLHVYPWLSM